MSSPVDGDQSKGHGETLLPLEVIQQTPMAVALHRNAVGNTVLHTCQSPADEFYTAVIIGSSDAIFCDKDVAMKIFIYSVDDIFQSFGIELVIHLGQFCTVGHTELTESTDPGTGVVLNTQIVVILDVRQVVSKLSMPLLGGILCTALFCLNVVETQRKSDLQVWAQGFHSIPGCGMGTHHQ